MAAHLAAGADVDRNRVGMPGHRSGERALVIAGSDRHWSAGRKAKPVREGSRQRPGHGRRTSEGRQQSARKPQGGDQIAVPVTGDHVVCAPAVGASRVETIRLVGKAAHQVVGRRDGAPAPRKWRRFVAAKPAARRSVSAPARNRSRRSAAGRSPSGGRRRVVRPGRAPLRRAGPARSGLASGTPASRRRHSRCGPGLAETDATSSATPGGACAIWSCQRHSSE